MYAINGTAAATVEFEFLIVVRMFALRGLSGCGLTGGTSPMDK